MRTYRALIMQLGAVASAAFATSCSNEPTVPREEARPLAPLYGATGQGRATDRYIVLLLDSVRSIPETARRLATPRGGVVRSIYDHILHGFSVTLPTQAAVDLVRADPAVRYVQQVEIGKFRVIGTDPSQVNPPWGLDRIDSRTGLDQRYSYWETGSGVNVYIIDTGIQGSHAEFGGRAIMEFDGRPQDGLGGWDCNGHGTHVAGTVGGQTYGVAKSANLLAVRVNVVCSDSIDDQSLLDGINWVAGNHPPASVANMSLGGPPDTTLDQAVIDLSNSGVTVIVSAGNGGPDQIGDDACTRSPARVSQAVTVGATTSSDARTTFSNFGTCVDIFAPGQDILSAWIGSDQGWEILSGTSMSAPHVAGTVARYLQYNPTATPATVWSAISSRGTPDVLTNIGAGSPNLLLYSWFVDASISGPITIPACDNYTWFAIVSGIGSSFTYVWERGVPTGFGGGIFWMDVGTGSSYSRFDCPAQENYHLRVTATNEFGLHRQAYKYITH